MNLPSPLYVDRLMSKRPGFRAKISRGYYVFEEGRAFPILGPFDNRREAVNAMKNARRERGTGEAS